MNNKTENIKDLKELRSALETMKRVVEEETFTTRINSVSEQKRKQLIYGEIEKARYWAGKMLELIGNTNPYVVTSDPANIPPIADINANCIYSFQVQTTPLQTANECRDYLKTEYDRLFDSSVGDENFIEFHKHNLITSLLYVRMHFGYMIGIIRDHYKSQKNED